VVLGVGLATIVVFGLFELGVVAVGVAEPAELVEVVGLAKLAGALEVVGVVATGATLVSQEDWYAQLL